MNIARINLSNRPRIVASISDRETLRQIKSSTADLLELRVDMFKKMELPAVERVIRERKRTGKPLILTVRNEKREGASKNFSHQKKLQILLTMLPHVQVVDIELRSPLLEPVVKSARRFKKTVIVSYHDFVKTPPASQLSQILKRSKIAGADIVKIAAKANSLDDVLKLMIFTRNNRRKNIVTMSVGELGMISRIVYPVVGSLLTYGYIQDSFAPGQLPVTVLREHLRIYGKK